MATKAPSILGNIHKNNTSGKRNPQQGGLAGSANANFTFGAATLARMPIFKDAKKHQALVDHIVSRLQLSSPERDARWNRCAKIDIQLSGFIELDRDDKKRFRDTLTKGRVKPTDHNLPLADAQLDDANAYLMSVFAPDMNMFESSAPASKASQAKALTGEINKQGQRAQYYRELSKLCQDALRYNFGAMSCYWEQEQGFTFTPTSGAAAGTLTKEAGIVWQGNSLCSQDVYNFFYDITVHPVDLPRKGEYFASVDLITPFRAMKLQSEQKEFGIGRFYNPETKATTGATVAFYKSPPIVRKDGDGDITGNGKGTNWIDLLRADNGPAGPSAPGIERVKYVTWINPKEYGLADRDALELWVIHLMQGNYITFARRLDDSHGMLPIACAAPLEDALGNNQRTYSERLLPSQHFASFLMNTSQAAIRKSIWGVTVYNQQLFPGLDLSKEDLTSAIIPMRGTGMNVDIDKAFRHYNDVPNTGSNIDMIEKVDAIMQKILPTDVYRQVADLERATLYQAAATVQTGNRRSLKIARMISSQCMEIIKFQMIYNIYANQPAIDYIDEKGKESTLSPADFVDLGLENYISNGLKGIDRLMIITAFKEVLAMILQSQQAIQELDIVKLLAYFFNLVGEPVDLNEFRKPVQQQITNSIAGAAGNIVDTVAGTPAAPATA